MMSSCLLKQVINIGNNDKITYWNLEYKADPPDATGFSEHICSPPPPIRKQRMVKSVG